MSDGLKVWDAAGNVVFDSSRRLGNVQGITETGVADGYVDIMGNDGQPFWFIASIGSTAPTRQPEISATQLSDRWRISWVWPFSNPGWTSCKLVYGIY